MEITIDLVFILFSVALIAGIIDAIAGGGGLLTIPTLLYVGVPPNIALGTNKLQGTVGALTSSIYFIKNKLIDLKEAKWMILMSFLGSVAGVLAILGLDSSFLEKVIPFLLIIIGIYFLFSPNSDTISRKKKISIALYSFTFAILIGFYDGFFGPGTGSFFVISLIFFLGFNITKATAHAKVLNFVSNLGALIFFALYGQIYWQIGLIMALGQMIGSYIGSRLVVKSGAKIIKPLIVIVSFSMSIKLLTMG